MDRETILACAKVCDAEAEQYKAIGLSPAHLHSRKAWLDSESSARGCAVAIRALLPAAQDEQGGAGEFKMFDSVLNPAPHAAVPNVASPSKTYHLSSQEQGILKRALIASSRPSAAKQELPEPAYIRHLRNHADEPGIDEAIIYIDALRARLAEAQQDRQDSALEALTYLTRAERAESRAHIENRRGMDDATGCFIDGQLYRWSERNKTWTTDTDRQEGNAGGGGSKQ